MCTSNYLEMQILQNIPPGGAVLKRVWGGIVMGETWGWGFNVQISKEGGDRLSCSTLGGPYPVGLTLLGYADPD